MQKLSSVRNMMTKYTSKVLTHYTCNSSIPKNIPQKLVFTLVYQFIISTNIEISTGRTKEKKKKVDDKMLVPDTKTSR